MLHHVDVATLERAFKRQRRAVSPGVDRVSVDTYEQDLENNLRRLHDGVHSGQYWPKPVLRSYIPKADGGQRPLGIPTLEDKIVQGAVAEVLRTIYEVDFLGFSHGFRPGRSPQSCSWRRRRPKDCYGRPVRSSSASSRAWDKARAVRRSPRRERRDA